MDVVVGTGDGSDARSNAPEVVSDYLDSRRKIAIPWKSIPDLEVMAQKIAAEIAAAYENDKFLLVRQLREDQSELPSMEALQKELKKTGCDFESEGVPLSTKDAVNVCLRHGKIDAAGKKVVLALMTNRDEMSLLTLNGLIINGSQIDVAVFFADKHPNSHFPSILPKFYGEYDDELELVGCGMGNPSRARSPYVSFLQTKVVPDEFLAPLAEELTTRYGRGEVSVVSQRNEIGERPFYSSVLAMLLKKKNCQVVEKIVVTPPSKVLMAYPRIHSVDAGGRRVFLLVESSLSEMQLMALKTLVINASEIVVVSVLDRQIIE